jgi:ADP-ribosyltransferase exoenzyme
MESPLVDRLARASRSLISEAEKAAQEEIAELVLLALVKEWDEAKHPRGAGGKFGSGGTPKERESRRIVDSEQPFGEITRAALTRSGKPWIEGANEDMILKAQTCADIAKGMTSSTKDLCVADGRLSPSDEMQEVGSKEVEDAIRAESVSTLVRQWAETSNDDDSLSLAIQQAAAEEFGIKDHAEWTESSPQTMQMMKDTFSENGEVYKDFLRTQYNATQAEFAKQGIGPDDTLLLYRGTGLPLPDAGTKIDAQLRPLSSYSTDPMVAIKFASRASDTIMATEVKVSDILSMPATGNGCLKEREMVILGGVKASTVVDAYESVETGKTVVEGLPDMASATKAAKQTINVDNNLINSDWIKTGSWGFPDITDLASYASVNGVNLKATQMLSVQLQDAMALPSWIPAPQKLKDEAKEYIDKVTKSLAKEWDESKHPRGAGGRFGSGNADQSIQNSATAIQSSIERSLGSMPEDFFEDPNDFSGVREYNTQARDASAAAIIEHLPEDAKDQVSKKEAVDVIDSWGVSANDTAQGLVIQDAAQKVFGLTDVAQADRTGKEEDIAYITKNFGGQVEAVLQAAYSATQERLAEVGLQPNDKITIYRGVDIPAVSKAEVGERLDFTQRALSSFTFEPSVAAYFSGSVLQAEVAAKDIVSMPGTGLGFASLAEVVVKPSSDTILTKVDVGAGGIVTKAKGGTINLDHDEASAHWLHRMLVKTQKSLIDSLYIVARERITVEIAAVEEEIDFIYKASLWAKQPQREYHEKLVRYYAPRLASALVRGVHGIPQAINEAKRQYEAAIGVVDKAAGNAANASPAQIAAASAATAGVKAQIKISPEDAKRVLEYLYGDAYMTGVYSAARQVGSDPIIPEALTSIEREIDWELWGPSESRAADIVRDGGLDVLLEDADVTIQGIFDTILDRLGNAIAYGLDNGLPSSQIADNISEVDPETGLSLVSNNAEMIASTTTSMAQSDATMDTYIENGVAQYWWLAEDSACDKPPGNNCRENMLDGPYDVSPLPDPQQPQHPNCRCTYLPVQLDAQGEITGPTPEDWQGGNADPGYIDYQANPEAIISLGTDATVGAEKSMSKEWEESKHPRDADGRFGDGGGDSFGVDSVASLVMERTDPWSLSGGSDAGERARDAHVIMRVQASEKLTGDEKKAVEIYTGKDYTRINGGLRGNGALGKQDAQVAKDLDTAIRYGSALSEETVLYRGITGGGGGLAGMKVGDTLLDNAFLSTTLDLRTAEDFMGPKIPSEGGYVMHITAPEGTRYLLGEPDELEVLLERGTALRVVGIDKTTTSFRGLPAPTVYAHVIG